MRMRTSFLMSLVLVFNAQMVPIHAQTLDASSDILGLRLDMSREDFRKAVESNMTVSDFEEKKETIGTADYSVKDVLVQYRFIVTPKSEEETNAAELEKEKTQIQAMRAAGFTSPLSRPVAQAKGADVIVASLDPKEGSSAILGIGRMRSYAPADRPLFKVLMDSITQKYGPPTYSDGLGYHWSNTYKTGVQQAGMDCSFVENQVLSSLGPVSDPVGLKNTLTFNLQNLVNFNQEGRSGGATNMPHTCGLALHFQISQTQDGYVTGFVTILIDEAKTKQAGRAFADFFSKADEAAKNARLSKYAEKKPNL